MYNYVCSSFAYILKALMYQQGDNRKCEVDKKRIVLSLKSKSAKINQSAARVKNLNNYAPLLQIGTFSKYQNVAQFFPRKISLFLSINFGAGKLRPGITFIICRNHAVPFPNNGHQGLKMEHEFPFATFRPEKQEYPFGCSGALGSEIRHGNNPIIRVPFTAQTDFPETFSVLKW